MLSGLEKNYFELFGLSPGFNVNIDELTLRYRDLQKQFHPDRFASSTAQDRRFASQMAAQINAAYQTLKSPLQRGRYLLELSNIGINDETDTVMNPQFLMEQMELRERLEAVSVQQNGIADLEKIRQDVDSAFQQRLSGLQRSLDEAKDGQFEQVRSLIRELQFLEKMAKDIERLEDALL